MGFTRLATLVVSSGGFNPAGAEFADNLLVHCRTGVYHFLRNGT
jgi:hypothetical protein